MKESAVAIALAIIGVAIVAIIVSGNSNTSNVINAGGNSFTNALKCAMAPITGFQCPSNQQFGSSSTISFGGLA